jgi:hypothetical protein
MGGAQDGCNWGESIGPSDEHQELANLQLVGGGLLGDLASFGFRRSLVEDMVKDSRHTAHMGIRV